MSEKKNGKEIDNEPVSSVSLQRNKDSLLFLCFMTFFYFWNTKSGLLGGVGGNPQLF